MHGEIQFKDLIFPLFVAGELEIISQTDIQEDEKHMRIQILKCLAYIELH